MSNSSAWKTYKLDQLGSVNRGRSRHRPRNEPSLYGGPYPFFQTGDIKAADLYLRNYEQTYSEKGLAQSKQWEPGTVCITIAANIAETAILAVRGCFPDSVVGFIADPIKSDPHFVKYYIDTIKLSMQNVSRGTTQDNLSVDKLLSFDFKVPHVSTQRKIASILSAYDDLIENNTRRIAILEEMAQAIYREWFVNFRFPGHENVKIVDSPLGMIPEGWGVAPLSVLTDPKRPITYGVVKPGDHDPDGVRFVRGGDILNGQVDINALRTITPEVSSQYKRTLLKGGELIVSLVGNPGEVAIAPKSLAGANIARQVGLVAINDRLTTVYAKNYLLSSRGKDELFAHTTGSVQKVINLANLKMVRIINPPSRVLEDTIPILEDNEAQVQTLRVKNHNLRTTRDLLLPKLISGALDVEALDIDAESLALTVTNPVRN